MNGFIQDLGTIYSTD